MGHQLGVPSGYVKIAGFPIKNGDFPLKMAQSK